jgi:hypothetical protein
MRLKEGVMLMDKKERTKDDFDWEAFDRYTEDCVEYLDSGIDYPPYRPLGSFKKRKKGGKE